VDRYDGVAVKKVVLAALAALGVSQSQQYWPPASSGSGSGISNPYLGTLVADAGAFANITSEWDAGVLGRLYVSQGIADDNNITAGGLVSGQQVAAGSYFQGPIVYGNGGLTLDSHTTSSLFLDYNGLERAAASVSGFDVDGGATARVVTIGSGSAVTNIGVGSCSLSSGQCNAVVAGAQGSSLCVASVQGTSQTLVGCDARSDAGSATAFCQTTASGTAAIICFN
jgi:hypothetical protein